MPVVVATGTSADPTVADLIASTKRHLMGMHRGELNRLSAVQADTDTTFTFDFPLQGIARGSYVAIEDEIVFVWNVTPQNQSAQVQRAQLGTTAVQHGAGQVVEVSPRFPNFAIRKALQDEIASWGPQVFSVGSAEFTIPGSNSQPSPSAYQNAFDLAGVPSNFYFILDVQHSPRSGEWLWRRVPHFDVKRNMNKADFASGNALFLRESVTPGSIVVTYAAPFVTSTFNDQTDLIGAVGLSPTQVDIPPYGAAWRLVSTRPIKRTFTESQGEARKAQEVPTDDIIRVQAELKAIRDARYMDEMIRLRTEYPYLNRAT